MKKILFFAFIASILMFHVAYADSLQVQKLIENNDIKVGDNVTIILKFTNPFGQNIPITIKDKNIFGNNGIDIQCLQYTVPNKRDSAIAYQPIKPFSPGKYTLEPAEITYKNPDTGKEETVKSNSLDIDVSGTQQQVQAQGITTIYRCNGMNMQSTSYSSSGGSFNVNIGGGGMNIQQSMTSSPSSQSSASSRLQNNQLNQNTNNLKKEMEQQMQQQEEMKQKFQKNLASNPDFQKKNQEMLNAGYNLTSISVNPLTDNTGSFTLNYQKKNGEWAKLNGRMENNTIKNMTSFTSEDEKKILNTLSKNKEFQKYDRLLRSRGMNQTQPSFNQISQNYTKITVPYKSNSSENAITADYVNGTIKNVSLENYEESNSWWWLIIIPIIGLCVFIFYLKHMKKRKVKMSEEIKPVKIEKPINYYKEARKMLEQAEKMFSDGKEKDAYEKVSQAVRFYFSYKKGIKKELISSEVLRLIRNEKDYSNVKKCLDLCGLVEFAKYKANKKDFNEIINIARKVITK